MSRYQDNPVSALDLIECLEDYCHEKGYNAPLPLPPPQQPQNTFHTSGFSDMPPSSILETTSLGDEFLFLGHELQEGVDERKKLQDTVQDLTQQLQQQQQFINFLVKELAECQKARFDLLVNNSSQPTTPTSPPRTPQRKSPTSPISPTPSIPRFNNSVVQPPKPLKMVFVNHDSKKRKMVDHSPTEITFVQHKSSEIHSWIDNYQARKRRKTSCDESSSV